VSPAARPRAFWGFFVSVILGAAPLVGCGSAVDPVADPAPAITTGADPTDVGPPPSDHGLSANLLSRLLDSTVHVRGLDCRTAQEGSGFVVDGGLVATGAHVVSGIEVPTIVIGVGDARREVASRVVAFDPVADLALLRPIDGVALPPALGLGDVVEDTLGAILVHDGESARAVPAGIARRIRATGDDIYGRPAGGRDALVLAASVQVGHSGSAVVDADGRVVGVAFSRARGGTAVAYAVQATELRALMGRVDLDPPGHGPCRDA